jgi:hypothetical protein
MKKWICVVLLLLLTAIALGGCVDIDEVMPHYNSSGVHQPN